MANGTTRGYGRRQTSFGGVDTSGTGGGRGGFGDLIPRNRDPRSYADIKLHRKRQELENDTSQKQNQLMGMQLNEQMRAKGEQDFLRGLQNEWYNEVNTVGDSIYSGGIFDYNPIVDRNFSSFKKDERINKAIDDAKAKGVEVDRFNLEKLYSDSQNAEVRYIMKKLGQQKTLGGLDAGEFNVSLRAGEDTFTGPNIIASMLADSNLGMEEYQAFNDQTGFNPQYETLMEKLPGIGPDKGVGAAPGIVGGTALVGGGAAMYAGGRRSANKRIDQLRTRARLLQSEAKSGRIEETRKFGKSKHGGYVTKRKDQFGKNIYKARSGKDALTKGTKLTAAQKKTWEKIAARNLAEADKLAKNLGESWLDKVGPKGKAGRTFRSSLKKIKGLGKSGIGFYAPEMGGAIGASTGKALTGTEGGEAGGRMVGTGAGGVGRGLATASMGRGFASWVAKKIPRMAASKFAAGSLGGFFGWAVAAGLTAKDIADLYAEYQRVKGK